MPKRINQAVLRLSMGLFVISFVFSLGAPRASASVLSADNHQSSAQNSDAVMTVTGLEEQPETAESSSVSAGGVKEHSGTNPPGSSPSSAASPLTPHEKFKYFARSSFMPPMPYALSIGSGLFSEATDNDHHRHMTAGDFFADAMTHAARS